MTITALAPWFGSSRMIVAHVGKLLDGCNWVGVPFAGSMAEVAHIKARTMLVGDHPLIRELYPADKWTWHMLESRTQANRAKDEALIVWGGST